MPRELTAIAARVVLLVVVIFTDLATPIVSLAFDSADALSAATANAASAVVNKATDSRLSRRREELRVEDIGLL
jgi:hypothetical protein